MNSNTTGLAPGDAADPLPVEPVLGVKETTEMLDFLGTLAMRATNLRNFNATAILQEVGALSEKAIIGIAGADQIPAEIGDLDEQEATVIIDFVKSRFDLPNDAAERIAKYLFAATVNIIMAKKSFSELNRAPLPIRKT